MSAMTHDSTMPYYLLTGLNSAVKLQVDDIRCRAYHDRCSLTSLPRQGTATLRRLYKAGEKLTLYEE